MRFGIKFKNHWDEGFGVGISIAYPNRCADAVDGILGTLMAAGVGIGLGPVRIYLDVSWDFRPYNPR